MKKLSLTFLSLLLGSWVLAESSILSYIPTDNPKPKVKKILKKATSIINVNKSYTVQGGGNVVPGAQLNYSVLITADADATAVVLKDTLNTNLSLVTGSVKASPIAADDQYTSIGNVGIEVNQASAGVLANDISPDGKSLSVDAVNNGTTASGGTYAINADGTFTYEPAAGFIGVDSFTYTLKNSDNLIGNEQGKVSISVSNLVYFVNSSVPTNGNGTLSSPFKNISNITGTASYPIFVYSGNYSGALTLSNNQKLIGQGAASSLEQILNLTLPPYSYPLPATGGTNPVCALTGTCLTLGASNELNGINFTSTSGVTVMGASVSNLKVRNVVVNNTGGQALQITGGGALDCIFTSISASGGIKGISVNNSSGKFEILGNGSIPGSGGTIQNIATRGVEFNSTRKVKLKNINFINANTVSGTDPLGANNVGVNASLFFDSIDSLTLDNIKVNVAVGQSSAKMGLNLRNCTNVTLTNSSIFRSGMDVRSAGIYATNTKGTFIINNSEISKSTRAVRLINESSNLNLVITKSTFGDTRTLHDSNSLSSNGESAVAIEADGTSIINATITDSQFLRYSTYGVIANSNGTSTINADIVKCKFSSNNSLLPAGEDYGNGVNFATNGSNARTTFNFLDNHVQGRDGPQINLFSAENGQLEGSIQRDTVIYNYKSSLGENNLGNGISISQTGRNTNNRVLINNNDISEIHGETSYGINVLANGNSTSGRIDIVNTYNKIRIGTPAPYAMRMTASDGFQKMCSKIANNNVNAGTNGLAQIRSTTGNGNLNQHFIEGNPGGSTDHEKILNLWNQNGNVLVASLAAPNTLSVGGLGTFTFGATCNLPTNTYTPNPLLASMSSPPTNESLEINSIVPESKKIVNLGEKNSLAASSSIEDTDNVVVVGSSGGFKIPANKSTTIRFSAIVTNEPSSCTIPNIAYVSGSNFTKTSSNNSIANVIIDSPSSITYTQNMICLGESVELSTGCSAGTVTWYVGSGTSPIGTGLSINISPEQNTTYSAACMVGGCESNRVNTTITVNGLPSISLDSSPDICQGEDSFLIPYTSTSENPTIYSVYGPGIDTILNASLGASPISVNLQNPGVGDSTYAYTLIVKNSNGCISEEFSGSITVTSLSAPTNATVYPSYICETGTVTLEAENCTGIITWYDASDDLPIVGNEPSVSENKTYYARCIIDNCISDPSSTVSVTILQPLASSPGNVDITWTGYYNQDWDEPCNWSPTWVPDSTNARVIITSAENFPILDQADSTMIKKLVLRKDGILEINGQIKVKSDADSLIVNEGIIGNFGELNVYSNTKSLGIAVKDSAVVLNDGIIKISSKGHAIAVINPTNDIALFNTQLAEIEINTDSSAIVHRDTLPLLIMNMGTVNYKGEGHLIEGNTLLMINSGSLEAKTGKGIKIGQGSLFYNDLCAQVLIHEGEYNNLDSTVNLGLFQLPDQYDFNSSGTFINEGILKANSVQGVENDQIIVTNSCPIFTIGEYNIFSINGIYVDSLLTIPAGVYDEDDNVFIASNSLVQGTQKLYAELSDCECCTYVVPFNFTNTLPASITVSSNLVCEDEPIVLDAICEAGTVTWYDSDSSIVALGTGRNLSIIPETGKTHLYYAACESSGCKGSRISISDSVALKPKPLPPTITLLTSAQVCAPNTIQITATGCSGTIMWSDSSFNNTLTLTSPGTYAVAAFCIVDGCVSDSSTVFDDLLIEALPSAPIANDTYVCNGSDITLTATCSSGSSSAKWFAESDGINEISPQLKNVTHDVTYYVACQNNSALGCRSDLVAQKIYIDSPLVYSIDSWILNYVYACEDGMAEIILDTAKINNRPYTVQWQILNGGVFENLQASSTYQNVNSDTLRVNHILTNMNNSLFRAVITNTCNSVDSDTLTLKVNQLPIIVTHPVGQTVCVGNQTTLSVVADGSGLSYKWQVNTGSGFTDLVNSVHYANVYTPNLLISGITQSFNNYEYRCVVYNGCQSVNSTGAILVVDPSVNILGQPLSRTACQGGNVTFTANAVQIQNNTLTYQWQISMDGGLTYANVNNGSIYSGVNTKTLNLTNLPANINQARFRCVLNGYCQTSGALLTVTPIATVTSSPVNVEICEGNNASFTVTASGIGLTYRWQVDTGSGFQNLMDGDIYGGVTSNVLSLYYPTTAANGYKYRCLVWGSSSCDTKADTSNIATLSVSASAEAHSIVWNSPISTNVGVSQAVGYILGYNKILQPNGNASYQAGQAIILEPGFEVEAGAKFEARIKNACQSEDNFKVIPDKIK